MTFREFFGEEEQKKKIGGSSFVLPRKYKIKGSSFFRLRRSKNEFFVLRNRPAESKTRTYHGRVRARRRTAECPGRAGPGNSVRRPIGSHRRQPSILPSRASKTTVLNVSWGARTKQSLWKPMAEYDNRLTSGLSAGRRPLLIPGCWPVYRRLFVSVNRFHARHVRGQVFKKKM